MQLDRRQFSQLMALGSTLPGAWAHAKDTALPVPASLSQAGLAAKAKGEPLVLLISLTGCVYCELVRRSYLLPARLSDGLQAWQLDVTDKTTPLGNLCKTLTTIPA
jgi:hypothetical protein